ncbi:MAG: FdtA/QdtA family cupin domain-containing protein [Bacteroidetes bacterium]|uniref:sugar 3,4-ketoisomerase n=1 Tax=Flavobacterium sp. TaxID=239 RepID=UPI002FD92E0D|nr:FdtA/QdtA family cupin domain-containing protein [Bacteroidota bacterium]
MQTSTIYDCMLLTLPKNHQLNGNLTSITNSQEVPFDIKRIYYLYDVPGGNSRGGHAHKDLYQIMIALSGSFSVTLDDGKLKRNFLLNQPYQGLLIPPGLWRDLDNFSSGSICMVLASDVYDENDYFRDYEKFIDWKSKK